MGLEIIDGVRIHQPVHQPDAGFTEHVQRLPRAAGGQIAQFRRATDRAVAAIEVIAGRDARPGSGGILGRLGGRVDFAEALGIFPQPGAGQMVEPRIFHALGHPRGRRSQRQRGHRAEREIDRGGGGGIDGLTALPERERPFDLDVADDQGHSRRQRHAGIGRIGQIGRVDQIPARRVLGEVRFIVVEFRLDG